MPMGTIIKLTKNQPSTETTGSMNNLYNSVECLDAKYFRTDQCKAMLLSPRSAAEQKLRGIAHAPGKNQDDFFICQVSGCSENLISYYKDAYCHCGKIMDRVWRLLDPKLEDEEGGIFVKGARRYLISDELKIAPLSTAATISLLSKQGVKDGSSTEEKKFCFGKNEISTLLARLLVLMEPLTGELLKNSNLKENDQEFIDNTDLKNIKTEPSSGGCDGNISVKLIVSKSNETVYYAEANEDFIDLLFSFLTIPLGYIAKEMEGNSSKGCAHNLFQTVFSLDAMVHLISEEVKLSLLFPSIPLYFGIEKQLLSVKEVEHGNYIDSEDGTRTRILKLLDPKSRDKKKEAKSSSGGYVREGQMFTVTDNLVITPISPLSGLSILKELNMPFSDIKERTVNAGKEEAARLLVASLISKSPLTDVFIRKASKPEYKYNCS